MARILTHDTDASFATDGFAFRAYFFDGRFNLHNYVVNIRSFKNDA
jgi:hypothetical protein